MKHMFFLVHAEARRRALACVQGAPDGYMVAVREPPRSLSQNAAQWPILQAFADQLTWPVNGVQQRLSPDDWKDVLSAAFKREHRIAEGLNGGHVFLGMRTSGMTKPEFSAWLDFLHSVASERGVTL